MVWDTKFESKGKSRWKIELNNWIKKEKLEEIIMLLNIVWYEDLVVFKIRFIF